MTSNGILLVLQNVYDVIGILLIVIGILNLMLYAKNTFSEVHVEIKQMHLAGIKKVLSMFFHFIVELVFSDSGYLNLATFCGIPVLIGLILLGIE